jgi:hypothetical protein
LIDSPAKSAIIKSPTSIFPAPIQDAGFFMPHFTKQERQVFLFLIVVVFAGLILDLSFKGRREFLIRFHILDDPSFYPKVNINKATYDELVAVPYLGPVTARLISERRPFNNLEELKTIPGIREGNYRRMEKYLKVQ